ncbi:hypothetical protein ACFY7H_21705 [Streptomyces sp. NPDC012794]|uniref:hypothetical protein n=1 Tax=Streptomyces sp. NPDC012794 TaxID=3364850 RepID=UPI0036C4B087
MRKIITGPVLTALTALLLTGCGGGAAGDGGAEGKPAGASAGAPSAGKPKPSAEDAAVKHEVTLEVLGTGSTQVYYNLETNKMEQVTLPWKKTGTVTLATAAEKRAGTTVSVVPGSVTGADGLLHAAECVITVDGKKVADNGGGKTGMCRYDIK